MYFHGLRRLVHNFDFFGPREGRSWGFVECSQGMNGWMGKRKERNWVAAMLGVLWLGGGKGGLLSAYFWDQYD